MKTIILAGGLGTRMREETEFKPKPMVEVGGRPILWHIMHLYAHHNFNEFVICTGYKGEVIKDYFLNYEARNNDITIKLSDPGSLTYHGAHEDIDWTVTVAHTGESTMTGGRVFRAAKYLDGETFMCTYGDGLSDVDISELVRFHRSHGKLATVTTVRPPSRFGVMDLDVDGRVQQFREKPQADGWVNAGFFVFEPKVLEYLDDSCVLEQAPLQRLAADGQLVAFRHKGYFQPMDTLREVTGVNELWASDEAPWRVW